LPLLRRNGDLTHMKKNSGAPKAVKKSAKLFFSGVLVLTVANLLVKVIGLLFKIPMYNELGSDVMGYYGSAYTIYTFFYMISTAGLPVAVSIMISESKVKGQVKQIKKIFRTTVTLFFTVGIVGMVVMGVGSGLFASLMADPDAGICIIAIAPTLFFICISSAMRGYFQGFQQMTPTAVSELIEALCKLVLGLLFALYAESQGWSASVIAAFAVLGLTAGAGLGMLFLCITKLMFKESEYTAEFIESVGVSEDTQPTGAIIKRLIHIALPITLSASVMSFASMIDMFFVKRLLQTAHGFTVEQANSTYGNYTTLAVPMFNLPPVLVYPIGCAIIPLLTAAKQEMERFREIARSALRVAVLIGVPCAFGLSVLSKPILMLIYNESDPEVLAGINEAAPLLSILAPSTLFVCLLSITNAILQSCGQERKPLISLLIGGGVKIVTNFVLIQFIGMVGTPISTFICYLTITSFNFYFISKHAGVIPDIEKFLRTLVCGVFCGGGAFGAYYIFSNYIFETSPSIAVIGAIGVAGLVYLAMIFVLRAVTAEDIKLLPKGNKICALLTKLHLVK